MKPYIKRAALFCLTLCVVTGLHAAEAQAGRRGAKELSPAREAARSASAGVNAVCPVIIPEDPVVVAPNQPPVVNDSTVGIINALCEVTLNIVGCRFSPTTVSINCDSNGDGIPEVQIPLQNVTTVNSLLTRATLVRILPGLPGTAFPLACCGGSATITMSRTVSAGDDNIFGPFTQSQTCPIDLGIRAPVVISASPSDGNCSVPQNLVIPGSCFILPDGDLNVTSVFAVEKGNPGNVIQATRFEVLTPNLIDALFNFGTASAGKRFLIFASGPNGTSRNLSQLPAGAPANCPLGNEQGVEVAFTCATGSGSGGTSPITPQPSSTCQLERTATGAFTLTIARAAGIPRGSTITVGGMIPKNIKFREQMGPDLFGKAVLKGKFCKVLPAPISVTGPDGSSSETFQCLATCSQ